MVITRGEIHEKGDGPPEMTCRRLVCSGTHVREEHMFTENFTTFIGNNDTYEPQTFYVPFIHISHLQLITNLTEFFHSQACPSVQTVTRQHRYILFVVKPNRQYQHEPRKISHCVTGCRFRRTYKKVGITPHITRHIHSLHKNFKVEAQLNRLD